MTGETKVLIIEDNPFDIKIMERILAKHDLDIDFVTSGQEALEKLRNNKYDVVVSDFVMPGMTGLDVLDRMKSQGCETPLIVVTGGGNEQVAAEAIKKGAYDYVVKSSDHSYAEILPLVIEQSIERHRIIIEKTRLEREREALKKQLEHLSHQMIKNLEQERRQISWELHDVIGQFLGAININLLTIKRKLKDHDVVKKEIETTVDITKEAMQEVRRISRQLHPFMLDHLGLIPTLEWFIEGFNNRTGMRVALKKDNSCGGLPKECEINLFRVVQETLTNSLKHGKVDEATVEIKKEGNVVFMVIEDKGIGFDVDALYTKDILDRGIGIAGMRERINAIGGNFNISSKLGQGTTVRVELPLH